MTPEASAFILLLLIGCVIELVEHLTSGSTKEDYYHHDYS